MQDGGVISKPAAAIAQGLEAAAMKEQFMRSQTNKAVTVLAALMAACGLAHASESAREDASRAPSVVQHAKHVAVRAFDSTRHGIQRGAEATVHGVKRGAQATGHGIKTGAHEVERVAHRVAEKF